MKEKSGVKKIIKNPASRIFTINIICSSGTRAETIYKIWSTTNKKSESMSDIVIVSGSSNYFCG